MPVQEGRGGGGGGYNPTLGLEICHSTDSTPSLQGRATCTQTPRPPHPPAGAIAAADADSSYKLPLPSCVMEGGGRGGGESRRASGEVSGAAAALGSDTRTHE